MAPAWTIQPTGTRFDPPIRVSVPNSLNLQPGETRDIYQWDHDLAMFVPMGWATVSEDGSRLITDVGCGITKAGWGGGGGPPPPEIKCGMAAPKCHQCKKAFSERLEGCTIKVCRPDPDKEGRDLDGVAVRVINASWEPTIWKLASTKLPQKLIGLEVEFKGKIGVNGKIAGTCCNGGEKVKIAANVGGDLELEGKWNWVKGAGLLQAVFGPDELGIYTKLKIFAGTAGSTAEFTWDSCKNMGTGAINVGFGGSLVPVTATVKGTVYVNGQPTESKFTPFEVGLNAGGSWDVKQIFGTRDSVHASVKGPWWWTVNVRVGEVQIGSFKTSILNATYSDGGTASEIAVFGTQ